MALARVGSWDLETLAAAAGKLSKSNYEKVVVERVFIDKICGYLNCSNQITRSKPPASSSKSASKPPHKDIHSTSVLFCSTQCMQASKVYYSQLSSEPSFLRSKKNQAVKNRIICLPASSEACPEQFNKLLAECAKRLESNLNVSSSVTSKLPGVPVVDRFGKPIKSTPAAVTSDIKEKPPVTTITGDQSMFDFISTMQRGRSGHLFDNIAGKKAKENAESCTSKKTMLLSPFNQLYLLIDTLFHKQRISHKTRVQREELEGDIDEDEEEVLQLPLTADPGSLRMEIFADNLLKLLPRLVEELQFTANSDMELQPPLFAMRDAIALMARCEMSAIDDKSLADWLGSSLTIWQKLLFVYLLLCRCCGDIPVDSERLSVLIEKAQMTRDHYDWLWKHLAN